MNTAIFFADGFEEIEGLTVVDMFRRAGIPIQTVSISDSLTVTGSHDIKVQADCLLKDFDFNTVEMLILPGGMPGTTNLSKCEPLCDALMQFSRQGRYLPIGCHLARGNLAHNGVNRLVQRPHAHQTTVAK